MSHGAPLVAGVAAIAIFAWWTASQGGYPPGTSAPGALALIVLLAVLAGTGRVRLSGPARIPVLAFAAFTAWSFASTAWADARGDAWDGANRTLLYLVVFALFATVPWRPRGAVLVLAAFAVSTVIASAVSFYAAVAGDPADAFPGRRFAGAIGYANALAALLLAVFWPAVLLACRRATPALLRGVLLAAAGVALELIVLTQSRGVLVSGGVTVLLALVLVPGRLRIRVLTALAAVALPAAASLPLLLDVFDATSERALTRAGVAVAVSAAVLLAAGWAWGRSDAVGRPRLRGPTAGRRRVAALAAVAALVAAGVALVLSERSEVAAVAAPAADSRFTCGTDTGRYDIWRVALDEFAREPLLGVGADNFAQDYALERRRLEQPLYPHSIVLRVPAQTGLVGAVLFGTFLVTAIGAVRLRGAEADTAVVSVAALVAAAAWLSQGAVDWLWEIPAVAAPAIACLGLVVAASAGASPRRRAGMPLTEAEQELRGAAGLPLLVAEAVPRRAAGVPLLIAAAVVVPAAASLALPALAAREVDGAIREFTADPAGARVRFDRARDLNPLSTRPDVVAGSLALLTGDDRRAAAAFARVIDRDERDWYPHVQLGLLRAADGRRSAALAQLRRARALNPRSPVVWNATVTVARGREVSRALRLALIRQPVTGPLRRRSAPCVPTFGITADCLRVP